MTAPPPPAPANRHQEGSLIFVMTTPPERTNKLTPRRKDPFRVRRVPNPYQVLYEDGSAWRTVHVNYTKLAKLTVPDLRCQHLLLSLPGQPLDTFPRVSSNRALVLLLLKQPHLPGAFLPLPQHQYPRRLLLHLPRVVGLPWAQRQPMIIRQPPHSLPGIRVAGYNLPPPRQPIKMQDLLPGCGALQG